MSPLDVDAFLASLEAGGRDVKALVRAWEARPVPDRLAAAFAAGGVHIDLYDSVVAAVALDEAVAELHLDDKIAATSAVFTPNQPNEWEPATPGLEVAAELVGRLPVLDLAEDIAGQRGGLRVEASVSSVLGGLCVSSLGVIWLDPTLDDERLGIAFRHELAHLLDPDLHCVVRKGLEAFAQVLGFFLRLHEPATVEAAAPLVARVLEGIDALRTPRPAVKDVWSILHFILLELACRRMSESELDTDRAVSGVKREFEG